MKSNSNNDQGNRRALDIQTVLQQPKVNHLVEILCLFIEIIEKLFFKPMADTITVSEEQVKGLFRLEDTAAKKDDDEDHLETDIIDDEDDIQPIQKINQINILHS